MKKTVSRRDFLKTIKRVLIPTAILMGGGTYGYGAYIEPSWADVEELDLVLPRLSSSFNGFRILQLSDIHLGGWMNAEWFRHIVQVAELQRPDLTVITGDFVLGPWSDFLSSMLAEFTQIIFPLVSKHPILAVLGNHDYWTNGEYVREALSRSGITEIGNDVFTIKRGGGALHVAGVDDVMEDKDRLDLVYSKLPDTGEAILLAHEPDFADISSVDGRFSLQLSGHSHGGQISIPFIGSIVLPPLGQKYPAGLYKVGNMWQYTNRGVGMLEPSIRINCRPEITVITLRGRD